MTVHESQEFLPTEPLEIPASAHHGHAVEHEHTPPPSSASRRPYPQVHTLLSWTAPGRPYKKRSKEFFMTATLLALLLEIAVFLVFKEIITMLLIFSVLFLVFVLALVPPRDFHYRISSEGITIEDHSYLWQELYDFYFKRRYGVDVLHVRTAAFFPGELTFTLTTLDREHLKVVLLPYLPYREVVKLTFMEKAAEWIAKTFPLEKPTKTTSSHL